MKYTFTRIGNTILINGTMLIVGNFTVSHIGNNTIQIKQNQFCLQIESTDILSIDGNTPDGTVSNAISLIQIMASNGSQLSMQIVVGSNGNTITNNALIGRTVSLLTINDVPKSTGYNQPDDSGNLVFTDGTTVTTGQTVTFIFS